MHRWQMVHPLGHRHLTGNGEAGSKLSDRGDERWEHHLLALRCADDERTASGLVERHVGSRSRRHLHGPVFDVTRWHVSSLTAKFRNLRSRTQWIHWGEAFKRLQESSFNDWRLELDGMVARSASFSVAELRSFPVRRQITHLACEEGWSYIAEWIGVPLSHILNLVGILPYARYVIYRSIQPDWWDSIDMADALHPQTLVAYGMNGGELPVGFGGPPRLRVPRQLGDKSVKYITRITVTHNPKTFGEGL